MLQRQIVKKFLDIFRNIDCGRIQIIMPDGKSLDFSGKTAGPQADLIIHHNSAISQFVKKGDIGFAESYRDGLWDSTDLSSLFLFGLKNEEALDRYIYGNFLIICRCNIVKVFYFISYHLKFIFPDFLHSGKFNAALTFFLCCFGFTI